MNDIRIGNLTIGTQHPPMLIAEMSGNHNQSLEKALALVDAAAEAGAHAIKLQTYTADTITSKGAYQIKDESSLWNGRDLYDLYLEAHTPWEWHRAIFDRAREKKILAFSSPFDPTAVDLLEELGVPAYKIASFENTDHILIKKVVATGKPLILSTGASSNDDLIETTDLLRQLNCKNYILLKCTSTYPASSDDSNLLTIPDMAKRFNCHAGLSDHTLGIGVAVASVALGARVIEKHFTLKRADGGVDAAFSMEPHEFKQLVKECDSAWRALGNVQYGVQEKEKNSLFFKRSLYVMNDIKQGETLTKDHVRSIRPSLGLHTRFYTEVIGKKAKKDISKGTPLTWDLIV